MRKLLTVIVMFKIFLLNVSGQNNLVPNGGFEDKSDPSGFYSDANPTIPCRWGAFDEILTTPVGWNSFGHTSGSSDRKAPSLFDSRQDCASSYCGNICDTYFPYAKASYVGIPDNFYENNPGNGDNSSQDHRLPIDWQSGGNTIGRYVGIKTSGVQDPGIYCKLTSPLKCGYVYTLKFYAVKKSNGNNPDRLKIRFSASSGINGWHNNALINGIDNEINVSINEDGGPTHNIWQEISIDFFVDEPNVDYLFIRCSTIGTVQVLLDDIEILNQCAIENACDRNIAANVDLTSNNLHTLNSPLTFFGSEYQTEMLIKIYPLTGQIPIRTIYIQNPGTNIAWDGNDNNGNPVANGAYRYEITYGTGCTCKKFAGNFIKIADTPCFETYWGTDISTGALTFYNLQNVANMQVTIYDLNGNFVTSFSVSSPNNTIAWDGRYEPNTNGPPVVNIPNGEWCDHPTNFYFDLLLTSECCESKYEGVLFSQICFADPSFTSFPQFSFKPVDKEINCAFNYNYNPYFIAPAECCNNQQDLFLSNVRLYDQQDFKLIHDIQAGPKVIVDADADILFEAGHEIRLVTDFTTEPGAEFIARIVSPCGSRMVENGSEEDVIQWSTFPELTINETRKNLVDSTEEISVYPNPTTEDLFVQTKTPISKIEIYDLTGKIVYSEYQLKSNLVKINSSILFKGVYIMQITLEGGQVEIKKVIKN